MPRPPPLSQLAFDEDTNSAPSGSVVADADADGVAVAVPHLQWRRRSVDEPKRQLQPPLPSGPPLRNGFGDIALLQ